MGGRATTLWQNQGEMSGVSKTKTGLSLTRSLPQLPSQRNPGAGLCVTLYRRQGAFTEVTCLWSLSQVKLCPA